MKSEPTNEEKVTQTATVDTDKELIELNGPTSSDDGGLPEGPGFMALYTTLMLLLMTFFIVLVSMGKPNEGDFKKAKQSLNANFSMMGLGGSKETLYFLYSMMKIKSQVAQEPIDQQNEQAIAPLQPDLEDIGGGGGGIDFSDGLSDGEVIMLNQFISLGFNITQPEFGIEYVTIRMPNTGMFKPGEFTLSESYKDIYLIPFLKTIGSKYGKMAVVVYTAEEPVGDSGISSNLALSALRAESLAQAIREIHATDEEKVISIGCGEYYYSSILPSSKNELVELRIYNS